MRAGLGVHTKRVEITSTRLTVLWALQGCMGNFKQRSTMAVAENEHHTLTITTVKTPPRGTFFIKFSAIIFFT